MSATRPAVTHHRTATVEGVDIFYREAGPADAPVVLLHGFPTSSHMFRNLIPAFRPMAPIPTSATCRIWSSTCSTPATSPWRTRPMRSSL